MRLYSRAAIGQVKDIQAPPNSIDCSEISGVQCMAIDGHQCHYPLAPMGIHGHPQTPTKHSQTLMDIHGHSWTPMDTHGHPWNFMEPHRIPLISTEVGGIPPSSVEFHGAQSIIP